MKDEHIIELLDTMPLNQLSADQLSRVTGHIDRCSGCRSAYEAARISNLLLRQRAGAAIEPTPFFATRVMSNLKTRGAGPEPFSLARMWKSAGLLVYSMAGLVLLLTALTVSQPASNPAKDLTSLRTEVIDWAVMDSDLPASGEMSYGQVLTDIYDPETERENPHGNRQ
jgi:hypothetical protein